MSLEDELDSLYASPPAEFLERRKALAQALRKAGRRDDATAAAGSAKPTPAAWAVNQLARRHPAEMTELAAAGERVRAAVRASFTGQSDAGAAAAGAAQREVVARLVRLAGELLVQGGAPGSAAVLERVGATLTAISTTGAWGGGPAGRLTRELEPPGLDALAELVADLAGQRASVDVSASPDGGGGAAERGRISEGSPGQEAGGAPSRSEKDTSSKQVARAPDPRSQQEAREEQARRAAEEARRAAAAAQERIERAEAAWQAAAAREDRARSEVEGARAAAAQAATERDRREAAAREARREAEALARAAEEARRKADAAAADARGAEEAASEAARAQRGAEGGLADAERALARAAAESIAAEEAVVRERRAQQRGA